MLTAANIDAREAEIKNARAQFVQQHTQLAQRIANIDGALELITLFRADIEAGKAAKPEGDPPGVPVELKKPRKPRAPAPDVAKAD